jgi:hypothetical protein
MTHIVELKEWQNADTGKCGSCHHFRRSGGVGGDWCGLRLPEWVVMRNDPDCENQRSMSDDATCDLWKPKYVDGHLVTFAKVIKWTANGQAQ